MCDLCKLEIKTKVYYEDDYFTVLDCKNCKVPMIVSKRHTTELNQEELIDLMWLLLKLYFSTPDIHLELALSNQLDQERRSIPDHWHAHIR